MGVDSDRVILSSKSFPIAFQRKSSEPNCFSPKGKNLINNAVNATVRRLETENSWNSKYEKDGKNFVELNSGKGSQIGSQSNVPFNVKTRMNSEMGSTKESSKILGMKSNGISTSHPSTPTSSLDSRKCMKHLRSSSSSSEESPNSVIRKQGMGSDVRNPFGTGKSKTLINPDSKNFQNDYSNNIHGGVPYLGDPKRRNILSYGNVYRDSKKLALGVISNQKDVPINDLMPRVVGSRGDSVVHEPVISSNHVLGLGGGNYGHGSIINVENLKKIKLPIISNKNIEEKQMCPINFAPHFGTVEELKNAGNDEYRKGHFMEALSFYDKAISLCPINAVCHNNKAAALAGLGRYTEAVGECLEAIDCDPTYSRAHYKLGSLYSRLGRVEDAKWHFKLSGQELGSDTMHHLLRLENHIMNMRKAQKLEDWDRVLAESTLSIESGADASDQVLAFKSEALLKLHKAKEALDLLIVARRSEESKSKKAYKGDSCLLIIKTQVYMYLGRFNDAITVAERAVKLDSRLESLMWLRKARAVSAARKAGNEFYKAGKYLEASVAYGQGLEYAPTNSVLICNRAACRSKLGQWEMAIDDCNAALRNRPEYSKALLQRAYVNARLERWEESLRDYTALSQEKPEDPRISKSLLQVHAQFRKSHGARSYKMQKGGQVTDLDTYAQFLKTIKSAGLAMLQFFVKSDDRCKQLVPLIQELSQRYPSWNFLKVDVEENPEWAKLAGVNLVPIFIIYKDGIKLKEYCKPDLKILEHALKLHST